MTCSAYANVLGYAGQGTFYRVSETYGRHPVFTFKCLVADYLIIAFCFTFALCPECSLYVTFSPFSTIFLVNYFLSSSDEDPDLVSDPWIFVLPNPHPLLFSPDPDPIPVTTDI